MNRHAKAAVERTGKPYGGHLAECKFLSYTFQNGKHMTIATGNLSDDPRHRFGVFGNIGVRTSYILNRCKSYFETRNSIYTFTEVTDKTIE